MSVNNEDRPLRDFANVHVTLGSINGKGVPSVQIHTVLREDVDRLFAAVLELHHEPGVNPANKNKTAPVINIVAYPMKPSGPFWWTTPGLSKGADEKTGVQLYGRDYGAFKRWYLDDDGNGVMV